LENPPSLSFLESHKNVRPDASHRFSFLALCNS
jgi:hypothetical protein